MVVRSPDKLPDAIRHNDRLSVIHASVLDLSDAEMRDHVNGCSAADYLRIQIGQNDGKIEWSAVRPDNLIDEHAVTEYEIHPSPIRSAIFDTGITSRINVAHFMTELITNEDVWNTWQGQMPVIYNTKQV